MAPMPIIEEIKIGPVKILRPLGENTIVTPRGEWNDFGISYSVKKSGEIMQNGGQDAGSLMHEVLLEGPETSERPFFSRRLYTGQMPDGGIPVGARRIFRRR